MSFLRILVVLPLLSAACLPTQAQTSGVLGDWREPKGSVIDIFKCGPDVCARIVAISKQAPSRLDSKNPDPKARTRPLCGLQIGYGFHLIGPTRADGGKLYDPKTGKTYRGSMTAQGDTLHLRGYIGLKAFGRTEDWTRAAREAATCSAS